MPQAITIRPLAQGWAVEHADLAAPMVFRSGAQAERAARRLAARLADAGRQTQLEVYLRDGTLAARFVPAPGEGAGRES